MEIVTGALISLLPRRLRLRLEFSDFAEKSHAATVLSASLQFFGCFAGLVWHYLHFMTEHLRWLIDRGGVGDVYVQYGMGATVFLEFLLLSPLSWCLVYFLLEGGVRLCAVLVTGEVVGTLPLKLADEFYLHFERRARKRDLPPLVNDEIVSTGPDSCTVNSCREKDWDLSTAVRIGEVLHEVSEIHVTDGPRPHVYRLRPFPDGKVARKVRHIDLPNVEKAGAGCTARLEEEDTAPSGAKARILLGSERHG